MITTRMSPSALKIEKAIARGNNMTVHDIRENTRWRPVARARMAVWMVFHDYMGITYAEIARWYKKDHTTVMYGVAQARTYEEKTMAILKKRCPSLLNTIDVLNVYAKEIPTK